MPIFGGEILDLKFSFYLYFQGEILQSAQALSCTTANADEVNNNFILMKLQTELFFFFFFFYFIFVCLVLVIFHFKIFL